VALCDLGPFVADATIYKMPRRRSLARLLLTIALIVTPVFAAPVPAKPNSATASITPLQERISALLNSPDLAHGFWGIEVVSLATGEAMYTQNAEKLFTPASNTKLFTTAAALALIGPEYKFKTTVETVGTLDRYGRLNGDLVLVGRGDPNLSGRELPYDLRTQRNDDPIQALEALADALVTSSPTTPISPSSVTGKVGARTTSSGVMARPSPRSPSMTTLSSSTSFLPIARAKKLSSASSLSPATTGSTTAS
jgi:D-alanyl-D-alanine carboxypeptidase